MPNESVPSSSEFQPTTQSELCRVLTENAVDPQSPILPVGGRTALNYGYPPAGNSAVVALTKLTRVVDYPSRDMTITVEPGIRIDDLTELLRAERQQLPVDVSQSNRATLGGVVATNTSGPRRFGYGTLRDYVIGITAVNSQGKTFHGGGRVVKNVAGYDICKMLVGSLGTLAVITQLTLKLKPIPEAFHLLWVSLPDWKTVDAAVARLHKSEARPVVLDAYDAVASQLLATESRLELPVVGPSLIIGLEGSLRETEWQIEAVKSELQSLDSNASLEMETIEGDTASRLLNAMTEFPVGSDDPLTFQASLPPSKVVEFAQLAQNFDVVIGAHIGNGIVTGHLSDHISTVEEAAEIVNPLRELAKQHRGGLVILKCDADWKQQLSVFGGADGAIPLMQKLKSTMDPQGLLNPGRFIDGEVLASN